ncbi:aminotransferase class I/II-fold pyridoxal phosphate-dependent enzyme [Maribacter sp.]|nr:aminotransferase class I/II-fold pyridoxal phosphate-dependent enzyme [Maribacter sp.]
MKETEDTNRRDFLIKCSLSSAALVLPMAGLNAMPEVDLQNKTPNTAKGVVNFVYDGLAFSPTEYLEKLNEINKKKSIAPDFYGNGGDTKLLEESFAKLCGKEKAIYLPTGTMANQLAIKLLSQNNTKVIVPENSHVFRDEADAAQSVHNKRLLPIGKGKAYFELADLKNAIAYIDKNEVFKSGLGTVVIENPIRRADGTAIPIETLKEIADYCKQNNYKMHLDGARIHLASAYTNTSLSEYASYFDTVYISLYKYLNAAGGAILCGDSKLIDQLTHQIKIFGGTMFQNWNNTAMAMHYLNGIDERWKEVVTAATQLISQLNKIPGVRIKSVKNGTNIYDLTLENEINLKKLADYLNNDHNIWLGRANANNIVKLTFNESLLTREIKEIVAAWEVGVHQARA